MKVLRALALLGGDWVIFLLIASSIIAIAVIIERFKILDQETKWFAALRARIQGKLAEADFGALAKELAGVPGIGAKVLHAGVVEAAGGADAVEEHMAAVQMTERNALERRLLILGTLGNNAPFIGLFGTVLGVIKAFHDLAESSSAGPEVVMQGLSEALIATAVGLIVAIPSVVAYNFFQKQVKDLVVGMDSLNRLLIARLKAQRSRAGR